MTMIPPQRFVWVAHDDFRHKAEHKFGILCLKIQS